MFEKFRIGGYFASKDVVLSCYACGKTTGLVADCGASGTVVAPVIDGWMEAKGLSKNVVGGRLMDQYCLNVVTKRLQRQPLPLFRIKKEVTMANNNCNITNTENANLIGVHPTFDAYMSLEMGRDIKEACCKTAQMNLANNEIAFANMPLSQYELPDGTIVDMGIERFQVPELFFNTAVIADMSRNELSQLPGYGDDSGLSSLMTSDSLLKQLIDTVFKVDADHQVAMLGNIMVTGGASAFDGLVDRLRTEIETIIHVNSPLVKVKTVSNAFPERGITTWLGGSIIGSLGSVHEMWVSKAEYEEYGAAIVDKKCP